MINQTTPNFLTGLQSTNMDLQSKLTQTNKEKPTPVLNFKPMSVANATDGKKLFSKIRQEEAEKFVQENKPGFITQQLAKIGSGEKEVKKEDDLLQIYLQDTNQDLESRQELMRALQDGVEPNELISYLQENGYTGPEKGFIGGAIEKTGEAFMGGLGRIKEAGVGIAEGKYNVAEGFARGGAGALESAFSPVSGVLGQTIQEGLEKVPQDFKDYISEKAEPTIEDVKAWYNSQSPEQQRNLQNIGVGVEILSNFIGVKGVQKGTEAVAPTIKKTGEQIAQTATDIGKGTIKKADEGIQATKQTGESVVTGLSKEQIKGFQSNPYQATEFKKLVQKMDSTEGIDDIKNYKVEQFSGLTDELTKRIDDVRATKGETGQAYQVIRELDTPVNANKISTEMESVLKKAGMEIKDGNVIRKPGIKAGELNQADVGKFNQLYQDLQAEILRNNGNITPAQTLDFRKTISDLAKYDASNTTTGQKIMQSLRRAVDDVAKQEIPGLRELDKQFVDKLNELNDALRDLVYKGGDVKGEWRSNIENIISTLDRSNRNKLAKRLEEVMPGITEKVQAINNIPTIYKSLQAPKLADKILSSGGALVGFSVSGPVGVAVGYAMGKALDKGITLVRKNAIKKTLNNVSESGKARMTQIGQKIAKNEELSKIDKDFLNKFKTNVQNTESSLQNRKLSPTKNTQTLKKSVDANRTTNSVNDNNSVTPRISSVARSTDSSTNNVTKATQERKLTPKQKVKSDMREKKLAPTKIETNKKISEGYKESAKKRFEKGNFTQSEIEKGRKKLDSLYEGKKVEFDGKEGLIISKPSFGKVKIQIGDKIQSFDTDIVLATQKKASLQDIKDYLKTTEYDGYNLKPKKALDNKGGYINPVAMVEDISKVLKNLTPKNTYNIATQISKKLGVEVKKVHTILKEYVSKYGEKLKDKLADLADDIADKTGARAKFIDDTKGTGISGKIDDLKELNKDTYPKIEKGIFLNKYKSIPSKYNNIIDNNIDKGIDGKVTLSELIPSQKNVTASNLEKVSKVNEYPEDIVILDVAEGKFIVDGHHRIAKAILNGESSVNAKIIK